MSLFEPLFDTLNQAGVRYVVVDGLATLLGFARLTADVDLVVDLTPSDRRRSAGSDSWSKDE